MCYFINMCIWSQTWGIRRVKWIKGKLSETERRLICSCRSSSDPQLSEQRALHHSARQPWRPPRLTTATTSDNRHPPPPPEPDIWGEAFILRSYRRWKIWVLWGWGVTGFYTHRWQTADPERRAGTLRWRRGGGGRAAAVINVMSGIWRERWRRCVSLVHSVCCQRPQVSENETNYLKPTKSELFAAKTNVLWGRTDLWSESISV